MSGTAAQTIAGLKTTSANYTAALQLLREWYENKHLATHDYLAKNTSYTRNDTRGGAANAANLDIDDSSMYGLIPVLQRKIPNLVKSNF